MKDIRECKVGDLLERHDERYWTDKEGVSHLQVVNSVVEITAMYETRLEWKTIEIIDADDVCPIQTDLLGVHGGTAFRAFDNPRASLYHTIL